MTLEQAIREALAAGMSVQIWPDTDGTFGVDLVLVESVYDEEEGARVSGGGPLVGQWWSEPFERLPEIILESLREFLAEQETAE